MVHSPDGPTRPPASAPPALLTRNSVLAAAAFVAVLASSAVVVQTSRAAFTAQTTNDANSFMAGTLALSHDAPTSSRFAVSGWVPGDTATECIEVTYTGTASTSSGVRLFAAGLVDVDGAADSGAAARLSDDLDLTIAVYAAGQTCATASPTATVLYGAGTPSGADGTIAGLAAGHTGYANALVSGWTPTTSPETRAFRITATLGADTADDAQGDSATVDFVWEIQAGA